MKATRTKRQFGRRLLQRMKRAGILARVAGVRSAVQSGDFQERLRFATDVGGDSIVSLHDVRTIAHAQLDALGVDQRDVALTFEWTPDKRVLTVFVRPEFKAVQKIAQGVKLRAVKSAGGPPPRI